MEYKEISKPKNKDNNLSDYHESRESFNWWDNAFKEMDWLPGGGVMATD